MNDDEFSMFFVMRKNMKSLTNHVGKSMTSMTPKEDEVGYAIFVCVCVCFVFYFAKKKNPKKNPKKKKKYNLEMLLLLP